MSHIFLQIQSMCNRAILALQVMALPKEVAEAVLGIALQPLLQQRMAGRNNAKKGQVAKPQIEYHDLEMHRIVGTGQFGMVRVVRHIPTNQAYALKVCINQCTTLNSASRQLVHGCSCPFHVSPISLCSVGLMGVV